MDIEAREELFDRALRHTRNPNTLVKADRLWATVVAAYREAIETADQVDRHDQRQLARAQWRRAMGQAAAGQPAAGLATGGEAITLFKQLHDDIAGEWAQPTAPRRDEALAELITAMLDVGEIAFMAGQPEVRLQLVTSALGLGQHIVGAAIDAGPKTREAMATAHHNHANALLHRLLTGGSGDPMDAAMEATLAGQVRKELLDKARPITLWELANTYLVMAQCLALAGEVDQATAATESAGTLIQMLGGAGVEELHRKLMAAVELIARQPGATPDAAPEAAPTRRRWWRR